MKGQRSLENFDEYNIRPPILSSPRSLEACKQQGIKPDELVYRYLESFYDRNISADIQKLRWQHYERKRKEKISLLRDTRQKIIAESVGAGRGGGRGSGAVGIPEKSSALDKEQKQIEAMKARRQAELEQMINYELKMQEMQEEKNRELARQKAIQEEQRLERQRRQKEWDQQKREKEIRLAEEEKLMELERKRMAAEEHQREKARAELEKEKEIQRKREARQREIEAQQKRQALAEKTQAILDAQQEQIMQRKLEMQRKEEKRVAAMEAKRVALMIQNEEQRLHTTMRIQGALEAQRAALAKKKREFDERQRRNEKRRAEFEQQKLAEIEETRQRAAEKNEMIQQVLERMDQLEEEKKLVLIERERESTKVLQKVREEREQTHRKNMELLKQKQGDKLEAVERLRRIDEYKREQAKARIDQDDARTTKIKETKQAMLDQRRRLKRENDLEKQRVVASMEKMRVAGKGNKLAKQMMEGSP